MYAAHLLWGIAQTLLLPNLIAGPLAMIEQFGDAYRRYMDRTGRILPKLST